jgi:Lhr-like helicase
MRLREVGSRPAKDLVLLLEQLDPLVRLTQRIGLAAGLARARRARRFAVIDREPALETRRRDAEVFRDLGDRGSEAR